MPSPVIAGPCRHCLTNRMCRPRGLCWRCWRCFYSPGVRDQHPELGPTGVRGAGLSAPAGPPREPTAHPPGSAGKVEELAARAAAGVGLWHPLDARA